MQILAANTKIAPITRARAKQNMQASETMPALFDSGINAGFIPEIQPKALLLRESRKR